MAPVSCFASIQDNDAIAGSHSLNSMGATPSDPSETQEELGVSDYPIQHAAPSGYSVAPTAPAQGDLVAELLIVDPELTSRLLGERGIVLPNPPPLSLLRPT